jgi:hypothetical protein
VVEINTEAYERLKAAFERSAQVVKAKIEPDENDEREDMAAAEAKEKIESLRQDNADKLHFRGLREKYARWVFTYLVFYSACCLIVLIAHGNRFQHFRLPVSVLDLLVGSTAVSAIGLVLAVTHGLFKR